MTSPSSTLKALSISMIAGAAGLALPLSTAPGQTQQDERSRDQRAAQTPAQPMNPQRARGQRRPVINLEALAKERRPGQVMPGDAGPRVAPGAAGVAPVEAPGRVDPALLAPIPRGGRTEPMPTIEQIPNPPLQPQVIPVQAAAAPAVEQVIPVQASVQAPVQAPVEVPPVAPVEPASPSGVVMSPVITNHTLPSGQPMPIETTPAPQAMPVEPAPVAPPAPPVAVEPVAPPVQMTPIEPARPIEPAPVPAPEAMTPKPVELAPVQNEPAPAPTANRPAEIAPAIEPVKPIEPAPMPAPMPVEPAPVAATRPMEPAAPSAPVTLTPPPAKLTDPAPIAAEERVISRMPAPAGFGPAKVAVRNINGEASQVQWRSGIEAWRSPQVGQTVDGRIEVRAGMDADVRIVIDDKVEVTVARLGRVILERSDEIGGGSIPSVDLKRGAVEIRPLTAEGAGASDALARVRTPDQVFGLRGAVRVEYDAFSGTRRVPLP